MSGRGRGGGRGGRGGRGGFAAGRKAGPQGMPGADDPSLQFNEKPQDTYPKTYKPPIAPPLSPSEDRSVTAFVAFRRAFHNTPLYTHRHLTRNSVSDAATSKPSDPVRRAYGQAQLNARFGVKSKASADPFRAVPLYSNKFVDEVRVLPDLRRRADCYVKAFFPEELWATLHGRDAGGPRGGHLASAANGNGNVNGAQPKKATKRKAVVLDDDGDDSKGQGSSWQRRREDETEEERKKRIESSLKENDAEDAENKEDIDLDDEEEHMSQEDDDYDDDEGGDYDAEQYFDGGDADDFGEDEGAGESAMDF
ncbi:DNA-directed RNA polymerase III, subunit Rpc31 [Rostrohypoxylon terebratum]|nr:DNA-directed RNA polymerase III, subunit Rpc31 [Rostrohypoxylon terebratum]